MSDLTRTTLGRPTKTTFRAVRRFWQHILPKRGARQSGPVFLANPNELYFSQQHAHTVEYFQSIHGDRWTRILLSETPHFAFFSGNEERYSEYLSHSWRRRFGDIVPKDEIRKRSEEFSRLFDEIKASRSISDPILLCRTPDGHLAIVDGNHRSAVALALGIPLPAQLISAETYAREIVNVPNEFYGTQRRNMPYQTIYNGQDVLVQGRRDDLLQRYDLINKAFPLDGKTILDLGSNYGMSSYLALKLGNAREACLVEHSHKVTTAAIRLSVLLNSPRARFHVADLREDLCGTLPMCDVGFVFSIMAHVETLHNATKLMRSHVREALFYETHQKRDIEEPVKNAFAERLELGRLGDRRLFLLRP